jgi:hypothetical protein
MADGHLFFCAKRTKFYSHPPQPPIGSMEKKQDVTFLSFFVIFVMELLGDCNGFVVAFPKGQAIMGIYSIEHGRRNFCG